MCGIVGAVGSRNVEDILLSGLQQLEYRGYDSAGIATLHQGELYRIRAVGKLFELRQELKSHPCPGNIGIGHTRWATHGKPSRENAHPHQCGKFALVHNGIIENFQSLKKQQTHHDFESETDSEVIAHLLNDEFEVEMDTFTLVRKVVKRLEGSYALAVMSEVEPDRLIVARHGSPLVLGIGVGEHFIASDALALISLTSRFVYLEEGDIACITRDSIRIVDQHGNPVERSVTESKLEVEATGKGGFRHYMLKEIYEQPQVVADALEGRLLDMTVAENSLFGNADFLDGVDHVQIAACGTSYHAGLAAKYWFEKWARVPCSVDIASELRYRNPVVLPNTLLVVISQSGETADTLAVLRSAKNMGFEKTLAICNVNESSMVRDSNVAIMTHAGPEVGVASTKAFTTQLVVLAMLVAVLGRRFGMPEIQENELVQQLRMLPESITAILNQDRVIEELAEKLVDKQHALFLGRDQSYPVAMEGALKLKEISYIHAEAYAAGELKHGPLALVDDAMPVIAVMPDDALLEKIQSNLAEVKARGGKLFVFSDHDQLVDDEQTRVVNLGVMPERLRPILFSVALQLLAYHVAVLRGTDVDQPRNLAKSVTVE